MPCCVAATALKLTEILDLPDSVATGSIFTACLPTTIGVNIAMTRAAGGDALLATFHSAIGNTIGPFVAPVTATALAGVTPTIDGNGMVKKLMWLVAAPLGAGMAIRRLAIPEAKRTSVSIAAGTLQQLCLLCIVGNVFSSSCYKTRMQAASDRRQRSLTLGVGVKVLLLMGTYYTAFFFMTALGLRVLCRRGLASFTFHETIAAVYCATQKTAAMGLPLLDVMFHGHEDLDIICTTLLAYHMFQILFGGVFGPTLLRKLVPC
jgi:predicted Na+-dependent transporter